MEIKVQHCVPCLNNKNHFFYTFFFVFCIFAAKRSKIVQQTVNVTNLVEDPWYRIGPWHRTRARIFICVFKLQNIIDFILQIMTVRARLLCLRSFVLAFTCVRDAEKTSCTSMVTGNSHKSKVLEWIKNNRWHIWPAAKEPNSSWCNDIQNISLVESRNYLQLKSKWKLKHFCFMRSSENNW